jgi:hypothetical protein
MPTQKITLWIEESVFREWREIDPKQKDADDVLV